MATFDQLEHLAALCAEEIRECNPGNAEYACPTDASDALLARCLHVTLACRQPKTLQDAWSLQPFALIASAEDILRAAMVLQHMGKARFNPPIEAVSFSKGHGFEISPWVKIEWVEAVDIDALWRAWGDATVVRSEWGKRADIGDAQTAIKRIDFTWYDRKANTTGLGRQPVATREEAQAIADTINSPRAEVLQARHLLSEIAAAVGPLRG